MIEVLLGGEVLRFWWGEPHHLGTSAYWVDQAKRRPPPLQNRANRGLPDEVAACLLGGHGIRAAVGRSAFERVRAAGLVTTEPPPSADSIEHCLREPLDVPGFQTPLRYRFPKQRAQWVAASLERLAGKEPPSEPLALREWLMELPGVGPKTASWIVRNQFTRAEVAIIDVHVYRAGRSAGFFPPSWRLPVDYAKFEAAFCAVARVGNVTPAALDSCVWDQLQYLGRAGRLVLGSDAFGARA
jgi:N-glycosylase/DNA lyase